MVIDKKGKIVEGHTNMFSIHFEEQLLSLLMVVLGVVIVIYKKRTKQVL